MNLIACKLCRALLFNDWDEKTHMEWHAAEMRREQFDQLVRANQKEWSDRFKYDADENTAYVDNAATAFQDDIRRG